MKRAVTVIVALAGLFIAELPLAGCSLIGLAVDASQPADTVAVDPALGGLQGKTLLITLRNGERFAARCVKVGSLPMGLYHLRYSRWEKQVQGGASPLSLNDTIHVAWDNGQITIGALQGFTRNMVLILRQEVLGPFLAHRAQNVSIAVATIDSLWTLKGTLWDRRMVQEGLEKGTIPTIDGLLVRKGETVAWVALDDVVTTAEIRHSYAWFNTGALADGAGLLAAVVYLIVKPQ